MLKWRGELAVVALIVAATAALGAERRLMPDVAADLEPFGAERRQRAPVPPSGDLQAALDKTGVVTLTPGATYEGQFVLRSSTVLRGAGASLRGLTGPALTIPPGTEDIVVEDVQVTSAADQSVIRIGANDASQRSATEVPRRVTLRRVTVPSHRGKRAFEINGADVSLLDCSAYDVWDPARRDSQAIWIGNTPGPVRIEGGEFSAGSEVIMIGGDAVRIPATIPADISIRKTRLFRPLSWQSDGVNRSVKNLLELKTGERVRVEDVVLEGSWKAGQDGYAVVITPRAGGAIRDVLLDRVTIRDVAAGFQITGHNVAGQLPTPFRTTGIVVRNSRITVSRAQYGGRGILALLGMGVGTLTFDAITFSGDGSSLILQGDRERMEALTVTGSLATVGKYGIMGAGSANLANWRNWLDVLTVTGNTFAGAAGTFKTNAPGNTYVPRDEFHALLRERAGGFAPCPGPAGPPAASGSGLSALGLACGLDDPNGLASSAQR